MSKVTIDAGMKTLLERMRKQHHQKHPADVGLVVRWDENDELAWIVWSENYPSPELDKVKPGLRPIVRIDVLGKKKMRKMEPKMAKGVDKELYRRTISNTQTHGGGHAEEIMLRSWAELLLPYNDHNQPKVVEIFLTRSPCADNSAAFVYNGFWPQGCAPKLGYAAGLLKGTDWRIACATMMGKPPHKGAKDALAELSKLPNVEAYHDPDSYG